MTNQPLSEKIEDKDFNSLPEYLRWFVLGALQVLAFSNETQFHQLVRQKFFNKGKEYDDTFKKAFLTINKIDIDRYGI